jgi:hypothetical protein
MMLSIGIEQSPDHALVLCVMLAGFSLKVVNASFAQRNSHFDSFIQKDEFFRARQEIGNDLKISERFVCIFYFPVHRVACLSASNPHQKFESRHRET